MRNIIVVQFMFIIIAAGCKTNDPASPVAPPAAATAGVSFQQNVKPLFTQYRCATCHGGTSGLTVSTVQSLLKAGFHGPAVIPGNPDSSLIVRKISPNPPFGVRMPQGGPYMADTVISVIRTWIAEGAKDN